MSRKLHSYAVAFSRSMCYNDRMIPSDPMLLYSYLNMKLRDEYGGVVPDDMDSLLKLPGVGRKSANLILGDVYGKPAVVADTHCIRLANRIGFMKKNDKRSTDPYRVEMQLKKVIRPEKQRTISRTQ